MVFPNRLYKFRQRQCSRNLPTATQTGLAYSRTLRYPPALRRESALDYGMQFRRGRALDAMHRRASNVVESVLGPEIGTTPRYHVL